MYSVGNFLDLLTSASAWHIYGKLWGILVHTGIAYIPLLILIASGIRTALNNPSRDAWGISALNIIEWRLYCAFAVILLAAVPSVGLNQNEVIYAEQDCVVTRSDAKRRAQMHHLGDQTQFDEVRLDGETVRVPLWWWVVNNLGQGLTAAATNSLPCTIDVRRLVVELEDVRVQDPDLNREVMRFQNECWSIAYRRSLQETQFHRKNGRDAEPLSYETDTAWAGSHRFLNTPGLYPDIYPEQAVPAFKYDALRDAAFAPETRKADGGWPDCAHWWSDSERGLRARLLSTVPEPLLARWSHRFKRDRHAQERLLYTMLSATRNVGSRVLTDDFSSNDLFTKVTDTGSKMLSVYGAATSAPNIAAVFNVLRDSAPIVHSVVMLVLIIALPFILMAGFYSPARTLRLSLVFLSILFWGFLFKLVFWMDTTLSDALFYQSWPGEGIMDSLRWIFNGLMFALYFSVPILFTRWASSLGGDLGEGASAALNSMGHWQILGQRAAESQAGSNS
jgi:hypothetical protein